MSIDVKSTETKGKRGYSKAGYPVVWLKKLTHEQCLEKLRSQDKKTFPTSNNPKVKAGKIGDISFAITCEDDRNITLKAGSITTYHRDMEGVVQMLRQHVEKNQIRDHEAISSLDELVKIVKETKEIVRKALS